MITKTLLVIYQVLITPLVIIHFMQEEVWVLPTPLLLEIATQDYNGLSIPIIQITDG